MIFKNIKLKAKTRSDLEEGGFLNGLSQGVLAFVCGTGRCLLWGAVLRGRSILRTKARAFSVDAEVSSQGLAGGAGQVPGLCRLGAALHSPQ